MTAEFRAGAEVGPMDAVAMVPAITPIRVAGDSAIVTIGAVVQDVMPGDDVTEEQPDFTAAATGGGWLLRIAETPAIAPAECLREPDAFD